MTFHVNILTLFPEMFPGALGASVTGRALKNKLWDIRIINIRDFAEDSYKTVDDTPYGGGAGMILKVDVLSKALNSIEHQKYPIFLMTPRGPLLDQQYCTSYSKYHGATIICGHYEGYDERILELFPIIPICIGNYIISSGEIAAYVFLDSIIRLLPKVITQHSLQEESFHSLSSLYPPSENLLLEYPQYTRPKVFQNKSVPEVLITGHHKNIQNWRYQQALQDTKKYRPDLIKKK